MLTKRLLIAGLMLKAPKNAKPPMAWLADLRLGSPEGVCPPHLSSLKGTLMGSKGAKVVAGHSMPSA